VNGTKLRLLYGFLAEERAVILKESDRYRENKEFARSKSKAFPSWKAVCVLDEL
jgi:hypothetical protein